jgi:RNA polymerase sigma-70 factor (ECF subfamily)
MPLPPDLSDVFDQDLVAYARKGHMEAFDELIRRYRREVYEFLHRMVRDADLADDLTQDVFVKAFRQLESHRPEHSFSGWIIKIANNLALDDFKRVRREADIVPLEPTPDVSNPRRLPAGGLRETLWSNPTPTPRDTRALAPALDEALSGLRDTHRQCFILREIEGRSYDDIAEIMDMPKNTVGTCLYRARRELRAALGPLYDDLQASSFTPA